MTATAHIPPGIGRAALVSLALALALALAAGCSGSGCAATAPKPAASHTTQVIGSSESDAALERRLRAAISDKGPDYVARTRHKDASGQPKYVNRLVLESSPYLLQHAHNPVNWFPWGDEAFARARELKRPVFLSIGYSTCHWCHVMEEESFEDEEIARYLNEHYVCIKVDREQRPDLDAVYMSFVQSLTGRGGWPMSVWLTPARDPFFGGTYFPPRAGARGSRMGFLEILDAQANDFAADPAGIVSRAQNFAQRLQAASAPAPAGDFPSHVVLTAARAEAARRFDPVMGGSRGAPKFPSSFPNRLLLRVARRTNDREARQMAASTLDHMHEGGIYDHVGGGFHRYAVDGRWLVPHFEKMLYDNALLVIDYLEAAQATAEPRFVATLRETLDYLLREMTAPDGTFYSATDADSLAQSGVREEGVFFTWTSAELQHVLGSDDARVAQSWFGVTDGGHLDGRSILHTERAAADVAAELGVTVTDLHASVARVRPRLLQARALRPPPLRDDKVIVSWNALSISALARTAIVLGDQRYADAAVRAAGVFAQSTRGDGPLPHSLFNGVPNGRGFADDHVLLAAALLDVFELTADPRWLTDSIKLMERAESDFVDSTRGGYYLTANHHESLLLRTKPDHDGPVPSVNSVAALTWARLYELTDDARYRARAENTLRAFSRTLSASPLALDQMLLALDWITDAPKEIVIVVPQHRGALSPAARPLLNVLSQTFAPNSLLVVATEADLADELGQRIPWARTKTLINNTTTAYVCERGACKLPTSEPKVFASQLAESRPYQ